MSVKDQRNCRSHWVFAVVAYFESDMVQRGRSDENIDLAEYILLTCDTKSYGSNGGICVSVSNSIISKGLSD